ncbi:MAG: hypothetical protein AAGB14_14895 [Verrucomicrobiota bacterium]
MSLRGFHIVFVTVATLLFAFLAIWALGFASDKTSIIKVLGATGVIGCIGMPIYGVYFYRKARNILL